MTKKIIDGVTITADFDCSIEELENYVEYVDVRVDNVTDIFVSLLPDDTVNITWTRHDQKFERIRRITGYLTGDLNTWNNAKQAEEHDRVKHEPRL